MTIEKITWVGCVVENYAIEQKLCDGPFSTVYLGSELQGLDQRVFKVAKFENELGTNELTTGCFPTQALATTPGGSLEFYPDPEDVLSLQFEKLSAVELTELVAVEKLIDVPGLCYYSMEYLDGVTFRQLIANERVSIHQLLSLTESLDRLIKREALEYHGDLKPENVMFTSRGVVLIDPGYFSTINDDDDIESKLPHCAITTPSYYPFLVPDDLFAMGLLIWESAFAQQPLQKRRNVGSRREHSQIGPRLLELVADQEFVGNYFLSPILNIDFPSTLCLQLAPGVEDFLLKALRLQRMSDDTLELHSGFASFAEISEALLSFKSRGFDYLLPVMDSA